MKYRIVKIKAINGLGEIKEQFYIQKRLLFFWFRASVRFGLEDYENGVRLERYYPYFKTLSEAEEFLCKYLTHPTYVMYKGVRIISIPFYSDWEEIFIGTELDILSIFILSITGDKVFYKPYPTIESLKKKIDEETFTTTRTIITK